MQRVWSTYLDSNGQQIERADSPHLMDSPRSSRRASVAGSAYSAAGSTRHILADMNNSSSSDYGGLLNPPAPPFANSASTGSRDNLSLNSAVSSANNLSLSVNYLPTKFSSSPMSPMGAGARNRKSKKSPIDSMNVPKRGGGSDAFKSGEARMPSKRLRWNKFKWILFATNTCLTLYSLAGLVVCLLTWFDVWPHSNVIRIANRPELVLSTIAACIGILTSVIGWAGILLNNRSFLAVYTFLTWITFAFLVVPGYITYRRRRLNLEGKVNAQWSRNFSTEERMTVQGELKCCGYFSPFVEATISQTCYARSVLPGCKLPYLTFERLVLKRFFTVVFALVPLQLAVMIAGLLCSNHITYRFGKGLMPEAYRLNLGTMAVIMENYANQLAEQYGADVAADILKRSRTNFSGGTDPYGGSTNPYGNVGQKHGAMSPFHAKYDSLGQ